MARFCTACGRPLSERDTFCTQCGVAVAASSLPSVPPPGAPPPADHPGMMARFCTACGHSLSERDAFCTQCGVAVAASSLPSVPQPGAPPPTAQPAPPPTEAQSAATAAQTTQRLAGQTEASPPAARPSAAAKPMSAPLTAVPGPRTRRPDTPANAVALPVLAAIGSLIAWAYWRPPLTASNIFSYVPGASSAGTQHLHGLTSMHGRVGIAAAVALVVGAIVVRRARLVGGLLIMAASLVLIGDGIAGVSSSLNAISRSGSGLSQMSFNTTWLTEYELAPSVVAAVAGLLAFLGGVAALRAARRLHYLPTARARLLD